MTTYTNPAVEATLTWLKKHRDNSTQLTDHQVAVLFKNSNHLQEWCEKHGLTKTRQGNGWNLTNTPT